MKKIIYLDNAATTKTAPEVVDAMLPYFTEFYGNASTIYDLGNHSKNAMNEARDIIADALGARGEEIYFTAGGSESDNWALKGTLFQHERGKGIITSAIEHHVILNSCAALERMGYSIKRTILMRSATGCLSWNTSLKNCPQKNASSSAGRGRLRSSKRTGNGRIRFPVRQAS